MCLPANTFNRVVFPAPLGPINKQVAPRGSETVMSRTTGGRFASGFPSMSQYQNVRPEVAIAVSGSRFPGRDVRSSSLAWSFVTIMGFLSSLSILDSFCAFTSRANGPWVGSDSFWAAWSPAPEGCVALMGMGIVPITMVPVMFD